VISRRLLAAGWALPLWAALVGLCQAGPLPENDLAGHRGYRSRPCGFDMDRDGVFGEVEDCRVCDGRTRDPDRDGVDEDLIYVDCQAGADQPACGSPAAPCRTVAFAWGRGDGPAHGAEDIVCFRGTCSPFELQPPHGGVAGTYRLPRSGHQARDFELPRHPAMLVGWDSDGDGAYPPHDADDVAVLDGGGTMAVDGGRQGATFAFRLGAGQSYLEMAHFTVRDYGRYAATEQSGFVVFGVRGDRKADAMFFHDLRLEGINRDQPAQSHRIVFNYFTSGTRFHYLAFWNLDVADAGGFMVRGSGPDRPGTAEEGGNDGPLRWQHLSVTAHGCDDGEPSCRERGGAAFIGWKLWGYIDGIEVLDSVFDANVAHWQPKVEGNGGALLVNATQCSRDWTIRGNLIRDFKVGLIAQGGNGDFCGYDRVFTPPRKVPRPTGGVVFSDNVFLNTFAPWRLGDVAVHLRGGDDAQRSLGDVEISRNVLASTDGFDACIWVDVDNGGGPPPGRIVVEGNLCWGSRAEGRSTGLRLGHPKMAFGQQKVSLRDNVVAGLDADDVNLRLDYVPKPWLAESATEKELGADVGGEVGGNVFDPDAAFLLPTERANDLEALRQKGLNLRSRACEAHFADPSGGRFEEMAGKCGLRIPAQ
jgi:hypothetical protein